MLKHAHQGRKGQTVIYCETQVQNNFKDKLKRVRSPWLIVIYCASWFFSFARFYAAVLSGFVSGSVIMDCGMSYSWCISSWA